ncbi:MAG TPA: hypothetical protein VFX70_19625 [Mycobacteriales bacterium]|nr:hypothetical protein [Mycobacteriales bacterium]
MPVAFCVLAAGCGSSQAGHGHLATTGHGGATSSASAAPPAVITPGEARKVVDNYVATLNRANKARDARILGTVETDSNYRLGSEAYGFTKISDPPNHTYAHPVVMTDTALYIPGQTSGAPWWAARITWSKGRPADSALAEIVVFTKVGGRWAAARRPSLLPKSGLPAVTEQRGVATELSASQASALAVQPSQLASQAATYLDQLTTPRCPRAGLCTHRSPPTVTVPRASSLTDMQDLSFWKKQTRGTVGLADLHSATSDRTFALTTANGGALVWCDVSAELSLTPPGGATMDIQIPTFYTKGHPVTEASVPYLTQLLVYDPPRGQGTARVIGHLTGPVAKG